MVGEGARKFQRSVFSVQGILVSLRQAPFEPSSWERAGQAEAKTVYEAFFPEKLETGFRAPQAC